MKSGAGDDPFADDDPADGESETPPESVEADAAKTSAEATENATDAAASTGGSTGVGSAESTGETPDIPWVLRRDSVKGERDHVHQFFLRDEAARGERTLRSEVEDRLDREVSKLDLREAAYLVAMDHPDEVAETLREWGYEYL